MHRDDTSTPFVLYNCKIYYINDEKGGWLTKFIARSAFVLFTFRENCLSSCNNSKKVQFEWNYSTDAMYVKALLTFIFFLHLQQHCPSWSLHFFCNQRKFMNFINRVFFGQRVLNIIQKYLSINHKLGFIKCYTWICNIGTYPFHFTGSLKLYAFINDHWKFEDFT